MTYIPPRTKPARRSAPRAARAGAKIFSALARKTSYADPILAENWPSIAGEKISALCRPGRILGAKKGGPGRGRTLEVSTPTGASAAELQMYLDDLIARVNRFLGPGAIARIALIQAGRRVNSPDMPNNTTMMGMKNSLLDQSGARSGANLGAKTPDPAPSGPLGDALASFRAAVANKNPPKNGKK